MRYRRTTRKFSDKTINDGKIINILNAGILSPSGSNKSPYIFAVVKNQELKIKIRHEAELVEKKFYERQHTQSNEFSKWAEKKSLSHIKSHLTEAPVLIVVFEDYRNSDKHSLESTWLAIAYMILAIQYEGLSSVTYTPEPKSFLNKLLEIPEYYHPQVILPVGYSVNSIDKLNKRPKFDDRVLIFK